MTYFGIDKNDYFTFSFSFWCHYGKKSKAFTIVPVISLTLLFGGCNSENSVAQFLLVPDTQTYLEGYPEVMERQFDWIAEQRDIDYVLHLGDVTQDNREVETYSTWEETLHPDPQHHYTIDLKTGEVTN